MTHPDWSVTISLKPVIVITITSDYHHKKNQHQQQKYLVTQALHVNVFHSFLGNEKMANGFKTRAVHYFVNIYFDGFSQFSLFVCFALFVFFFLHQSYRRTLGSCQTKKGESWGKGLYTQGHIPPCWPFSLSTLLTLVLPNMERRLVWLSLWPTDWLVRASYTRLQNVLTIIKLLGRMMMVDHSRVTRTSRVVG